MSLAPYMKQRLKRPDLKEHDIMLLVALRYGSLTDYSQPFMDYNEISRHFKLAASVVHNAIRRYHNNGNKYVMNRKGKVGIPHINND